MSSSVRLQDLTWIRPSYIIPRQDFVSEALVPCLDVADSYRCMAGFFDSGALRDIAPGLAEYISRPDKVVRLIASPYISDGDQEALKKGVTTPAKLLEEKLLELCGKEWGMESALATHTLDCLAYLVAAGRLEMKVSFVPGGLFHPKVWIFDQGDDTVVLHGSSNFTHPGLQRNVEQVSVSRSWRGDDQATIVNDLVQEFETLWRGGRSYALVIDLPEAVRRQLLQRMPLSPPSAEAFKDAWERDERAGLVEGMPADGHNAGNLLAGFRIPAGLDYESGDFAHQGKAVTAWESAGRTGILEMATGSGKTITALVAAQRLYRETGRLLLCIAAPYLPLIDQWRSEARLFGLNPVVPNDLSSRKAKLAAVAASARRAAFGSSAAEVLVVSHDLLCDAAFQDALRGVDVPMMLIGDEVHHLGRPTFIQAPPEFFATRLGLSATPVRQYDPEGTDALTDFFGDVVFQFTLADAIGVCLVPYDYFLHPVYLTDVEGQSYLELTEKLRKLGWRSKDSNTDVEERIQRLQIRRRAVLEKASGKLDVLRELLVEAGPRRLHHSLVYASAKGREQLTAVNQMLAELSVHYHQLTAQETAQPSLAARVLSAFSAGQLQVLTAMRVLDEGVNIPQIETAYILASSTVEREWVQRRGRVLRKCDAIGKESATIHDFLVLPPLGGDDDIRGLLKAELDRAREFAALAKNAAAPGGPLAQVQSVINEYFS